MRPDPDRVLRGVAMSLMMEVAPQVQTAFGQATVRMAGMLTLHAAAVVDGLADRLVKENAALAELLDAGSEVVGDPALAERLHAARTAGEVADLKVSTLVAANDRLRALLTELHAAVEGLSGEKAEDFNERIWEELIESTRRRHVEPMA